jgi:hypothetical protein
VIGRNPATFFNVSEIIAYFFNSIPYCVKNMVLSNGNHVLNLYFDMIVTDSKISI